MKNKYYIGIKGCGCVECVIADFLDETEERIKEWKEIGLSIKLVDVEEARRRLGKCNCQRKLNSNSIKRKQQLNQGGNK